MKFGKLEDIQAVDFVLPPDPPANRSLLADLQNEGALRVFLGATGWSMKEWKGSVYPEKTPASGFLAAYGRQFNTIELNTTHYRVPTAETIEKWVRQTPSDFRFCPKVPQAISHRRDLGVDTDTLPAFVARIAGLEERLGPCFLQLPPYFAQTHWEVLDRFLGHWPPDIRLAIEFRHPSWFAFPDRSGRFFDQLREKGIGMVITDVAGRRDVLHMRLTAPWTLVRFVGNGLHPTDYQRAGDWISRLSDWARSGLREAYFFPHQPDNLQAPEMIAHFTEKMQGRPEFVLRGPNLQRDNAQISLFG